MSLGSLITGKLATRLTVNQMKRDHAEWAKTVTPGSVWYSKEPTTNWAASWGGTQMAHSRYEFVKPAGWPHSCGWVTAGGCSSWEIWNSLCGTGLTQERMPTCADYNEAAERLFKSQAEQAAAQVAKAAGWDPAWTEQVEKILAGAR